MKDLQTGEITPPLDHETYTEEFAKRVEAERIQRAKGSGARGRAAAAQEEDDDEEPEFHGKPLSFYDGKSDDQITKIPGIAEGTLAKIRAAQKSRDAKK
jgi:hypothetical protein